jgi:CRISPR/Cas system-associated exonuclease Cas4 (RecB family)
LESENFLNRLAQKCQAHFGAQCDKLTIIFPNKRAGVYFADYLSQKYDQPVWSPTIQSFDEYVAAQQDSNLADDLQMIFVLYQAYQQIIKQPESFDAFFPWGEMILKDFNDIDNYLVNTDHIFSIIKSQKELDESFQYLSEKDQETIQNFWKGFLPEPSKKQTEFLTTWSILAELYAKFNALLANKNLIYKGKMFRVFCESAITKEKNQYLWFAGFNALTKAEETIIKKYLALGNCDIFWELDDYYLRDNKQEAGEFFRQYSKDIKFKPSIERDTLSCIQTSNIKLGVVSAPFGSGQIKVAAQKIDSLSKKHSNMSDVLVILPDESMLPNLLESLSSSIDKINVTMGWPLADSRFYIFIIKVIALHTNLHKNKSHTFYHGDLMSLLEYSDLLGIQSVDIQAFESDTIKTNRIYHPKETIDSWFPILTSILSKPKDTAALIDTLVTFIEGLDLDSLSSLEKPCAISIHTTFKRIKSATKDHGILLVLKSFYKLFQKLGKTIKIPLAGDPKGGLQIMGILETRNLSFKNILIVGMNEGAWPSSTSNNSFIPFNIRKAFDLPTTSQQDAMQSYLFYRLLTNTENLWAFYNNITAYNHNGELSRYIQQLQYETNLTFTEENLINPVEAESEPEIIIEKSDRILKILHQSVLKGSDCRKRMSPSALNTYIDCSLKFYFQHVEKIREPDHLIEDMDPSLFGNLLHRTMELVYQKQSVWTKEDLVKVKSALEEPIKKVFKEFNIELDSNNAHSGRQLIAHEVLIKYIEKIVAFDMLHSPFEILGLEEEKLVVDFPIEIENDKMVIGLKGIIDRVDKYESYIRIIDYKSGRDNKKFAELSDLIDGTSTNRNKAVFQLFYYCMLYKENNADSELSIQPGMFNSLDLFDDKFDTKLTQRVDKKSNSILDYQNFEIEFRKVLAQLLEDIFNPKLPFIQTEDLKKCQYCTYNKICKRA